MGTLTGPEAFGECSQAERATMIDITASWAVASSV
jgi:hypothetical protein